MQCPRFTHKAVEDNMKIQDISPKRWADDEEVSREEMDNRHTYIGSDKGLISLSDGNIKYDQDDKPINPVERTGLRGRGLLGKWGPNHAADPIIAYLDNEGSMWAIVVRRKDTGQYAIPGGMVDAGDTVSQTLVKELSEEAVDISEEYLNRLFDKGMILYTGYVNDPRNTDNAWMETCVCGVLITGYEKEQFKLKEEDSEHNADSAQWIKIGENSEKFNNMYADHKWYLRMMKAAVVGVRYSPSDSDDSSDKTYECSESSNDSDESGMYEVKLSQNEPSDNIFSIFKTTMLIIWVATIIQLLRS